MRRSVSLFIAVTIFIAACGESSPSATPAPDNSPIAPLITDTAAVPAQGSTSEPAELFSGPGNRYFDKLAVLPAGSVVSLLGTYGDFIKVALRVADQEVQGYVLKSTIEDLPNEVSELTSQEVPWPNYFMASCAPDGYDLQTNIAIISAVGSEVQFTPESLAWSLEAPVRVKIDRMEFDGTSASLNLFGRLTGQESSTNWFQGVKEMAITTFGGNYLIGFWDGSSNDPVGPIDTSINSMQPIQILFDQPEGKSFSILDGEGREIKHVDLTTYPGLTMPDGLFPYGEFYFGLFIPSTTTLRLSGFEIGMQPSGRWQEEIDPGLGLAELGAVKNLRIGTFFEIKKAIDRRYCQALLDNFNVISPFIDTKTWLGPNQYDFTSTDRYVAFAKAHELEIFNSVAWGAPSALPDWLMNSNYDRDEYINILKNLVEAFVNRYKDEIHIWEIANEAGERDFLYPRPYSETNVVSPNPYMRDFWYEKIGPDYIEMAFRWAHAANPQAILLFNTSTLITPVNQVIQNQMDFIYNMVKGLKDKGVPLDAVGFQMHLGGPQNPQIPPTKDQIIDILQQYSSLGLRFYYTELELDLGSITGTEQERYTFQARVYRDLMDACLETGACDMYMVWGYTDALSYITCTQTWYFCSNEPNGDPLIFDKYFNPKPAYFALQDALSGVPAPAYPTPAPQPSLQTLAANCTAQSINPNPIPESKEWLYDDFDNPAYNESFNSSLWKFVFAPQNPIARQMNGVFAVVNNYDELYMDTVVQARNLGEFIPDQPLSIQADIALCPESTGGSIGIYLRTTNFPGGLWSAGCTIDKYSAQVSINCGDMLWTAQTSNSYSATSQAIDPGIFHRIRFEIDPTTTTITYFLDGVLVGSHMSENAELLQVQKMNIVLSTWKTSLNSPLMGLFDNVLISDR